MTFSILDWNIQGKKYYTQTNFKKIQPVLEDIKADIVCLQEGEPIIDKLNYFKQTHKYNYAFSREDKDGINVILSKFKIIKTGQINCSSFLDKTTGEVIWVDLEVYGKILKLYNCHFEIDGVGPKERAAALKFILTHSSKHFGPTIICGDFNTTVPAAGFGRQFIQWFHKVPITGWMAKERDYLKDERYSFVKIFESGGFQDMTDIEKTTWSAFSIRWEIFNLKLDWFAVRQLKASKAILGKYISDHRSILVKCDL